MIFSLRLNCCPYESTPRQNIIHKQKKLLKEEQRSQIWNVWIWILLNKRVLRPTIFKIIKDHNFAFNCYCHWQWQCNRQHMKFNIVEFNTQVPIKSHFAIRVNLSRVASSVSFPVNLSMSSSISSLFRFNNVD